MRHAAARRRADLRADGIRSGSGRLSGTEVGGKFPTDPAVLNKALDLRGIKIASQWFSSFLCSTPYEENEKAFIEQLDFLELSVQAASTYAS